MKKKRKEKKRKEEEGNRRGERKKQEKSKRDDERGGAGDRYIDWDEKGYAKEVCSNKLQQNHATKTPEVIPEKFDCGGVLQGDGDNTSKDQHWRGHWGHNDSFSKWPKS